MRNESAVAMFLLACVAHAHCTDSKRRKRIAGFLEEAEADLDAEELHASGAWHEPPTGSVSRTADGNLDLEPGPTGADHGLELAAGANGPSEDTKLNDHVDKPPQ